MLSAASFESRGSLLARASLVSPVRSRHLEAAFRSPITSAPGRPLRGLRSRPASSTPRWILLRSVRPAAPRWRRFALALAISTPPARCPDSSPSIPVSPRIGSPLGLPSPRDQLNPICCREARLPKRSHLLSLPALGTPTAVPRSRSATIPEAGCSSNLLEPLQFSSRSHIEVNQVLKSLIARLINTLASAATHVHL
jgi:hypothetical protein